MRMLMLSFTAATTLLSACDTGMFPIPVPVPVPPADACGAAQLQVLIGQPVTVLPDAGQWSTVRVIRPGEAITMDFSATRLNVEIDANARIIRIFCG